MGAANDVAVTGDDGALFHASFLLGVIEVTLTSQPCSTRAIMSFTQALPRSLSPSRLADFQACPRRYQYASIERIPQPASYATAKGRFAHFVFEQLFKLRADDRTIERAREFVPPAVDAILTEDVSRRHRHGRAMMLAKLLAETDAIITTYFEMEDPDDRHAAKASNFDSARPSRARRSSASSTDSTATPTGRSPSSTTRPAACPNRNYDSQTFANAELYAALCEAKLGEQPTKIRLMYVAKGESIERNVTDVVVKARSHSRRERVGEDQSLLRRR